MSEATNLQDLYSFRARDGACVFFVRDDDATGEDSGTLEIVANAEGWRSLSEYCAIMASLETPDMSEGDHSWLARHFGEDFSADRLGVGCASFVVNGREYPDGENWVMFLKSDLNAREFMDNRRRLSGGSQGSA